MNAKHLPFMFIISLLVSNANSQETAEMQKHDNTRVSVYFHPLTTFFSPIIYDPLELYLTIEIPFSLYNSLIISPNLWHRKSDIYDEDLFYFFRAGLDIGFRHFLFWNGEGLYLQPKFGAYMQESQYKEKHFSLEVSANLGYSLKFSWLSMFVDFGYGFGNQDVFLNKYPAEGFASFIDISFGLGIPFGSGKPATEASDNSILSAYNATTSFISGIGRFSRESGKESNNDNSKVSVYLHPTSFFYWINVPMTVVYTTIEIPLSLSNSLIIKPSLWYEWNHYADEGEKDEDLIFRLGSDIGIRHFLNGNGNGFYLQGQIGAFYYKGSNLFISEDDCDEFCSHEPPDYGPSLWIDAMGYFGYSWKFSRVSLFADIGFGLAFGRMVYPLLPDFNIGIGIPF